MVTHTRFLSVTVTPDHIRRGIRNNVWHCALALAIRELPGREDFTVEKSRCGGRLGWYKLPPDAQKFVDDFDNLRPVQSTTFRMLEMQ